MTNLGKAAKIPKIKEAYPSFPLLKYMTKEAPIIPRYSRVIPMIFLTTQLDGLSFLFDLVRRLHKSLNLNKRTNGKMLGLETSILNVAINKRGTNIIMN